ncbi:hypothetical protein GTA08_BOTSDO12168 [Botryosphaeria dothidea]|uniref:Uncharacterized protein n=1 Tax=Botryosphaeria dothidea TaxID=55169 RepID=A0A8H4J6V8_9PEZI|nr:hypothetical protein GTA08_BOTSDO12168 [Botryosphaeria dothidea]
MFRSRRRATSNPPPNRNASNPTPTAALAASQAFLKNANSNASLSSAAAAAALRTHSTSPVPVGSIQTKRMQRRGSGASAASAPAVRRQPSSGSMMPAIPKDLSPAPQHRRAASEAVTGSSKQGDRSTGGAADRSSRASAVATPPSSPPPTKTSHSGWFTSPVTNEQKPRQDIRSTAPITPKAAAGSTTGLEQSVHNAAIVPVAKKKKKKAPGAEGSHLTFAISPYAIATNFGTFYGSSSQPTETSSPVAFNIGGRANSDVSSDAGSYDGYKPSPRKKRGVRVSFEENLTRDGDSPSSPGSPVGLDSSRWSGRTLQGMDDDLDDIMKPRPALPFFGSIRRERRPVDEEIAEKVTETIPSMSNSTSTMAEPLEASSDHAVGGIIARDFETRNQTKGTSDPMAPEVTSVEGSGYVSDDTASSIDDEELGHVKEPEGYAMKARSNGATELPSIPEKRSAEASPAVEAMPVPQIAVQPATPGTEVENQEPAFEMPGAWSDPDESSFDESLATTTASLGSQEHIENSEPVQGGHFHVFSAKDLQPIESRQSVDHYLDQSQDEESSDDNSSIYSDAAEDLSEFEGGFASLDAIVDSPIVPPSQESQLASIPESPLSHKQKGSAFSETEYSIADQAEDDSKKRREREDSKGAETKHRLSPKAAALEFDAAPILKSPKPKKKKATVIPEPIAVAVEPARKSTAMPQARQAPQPKKPALRTSMRTEKPETQTDGSSGPTMRKPMRMSMRKESTGLAASRLPLRPVDEVLAPALQWLRIKHQPRLVFVELYPTIQMHQIAASDGKDVHPHPPQRVDTRSDEACALELHQGLARPYQRRLSEQRLLQQHRGLRD